MNLGRVIGSVWATRKYASLHEQRMLFVLPLNFEGQKVGDPIVALDTMDAGVGDTVIYVSSTEAAVPFKPKAVPTDATIVGVIESVAHEKRTWKPEMP